MTFKGINFRQLAVHPSATDSADDTYWHRAAAEAFPTATRSPFTGGFGRDTSTGVAFNAGAERSGTGVDARLAGIVSNAGAGGNTAIKITLPNGAGDYRCRVALGDRLAARSGMNIRVKDGATSLHYVSGIATGAADSFSDINGTIHTAANWPANNTTVLLTFTGTVATFEFGDGVYLNHIAVEHVPPASTLSGEAILSGITAEGGMAPQPDSSLSGEAILSGITAEGGMGLAPGVLTAPTLKNNTGTILASVSGIVANVYNPSTGALVVRKTGLSSNGSGVVTISDVLLVPGTTYAYELDLSATSQGRRLPTGVAA